MSQGETWTTRRLLEWTTSFLKEKEADSPRLEAEILLANALSVSRVDLYVNFDDVPNDEKRAKFRNLVKRRGLGEPVAYLVGRKEFYSLDFEVDANVLVPRPETEHLVLETIETIKKSVAETPQNADSSALNAPTPKNWNVCDVGTGSGCVAIALAKNLPNARLTALDVSPGALAVARKNAAKHNLEDRIEFVESDLFAALSPRRQFDVVVSNPPYVSEAEYATLSRTVRDFEPKIALVGGKAGTEIVAKIVAKAPEFLKPGGKIFIEIGPATADATVRLFRDDGRWENVAVLQDFAKLNRIVSATSTFVSN